MIFKVSRSVWAVVFTFTSMLALGLSDNIRGPLFPDLIKYFELSNTAGSLSFAFASAAALLTTLASAPLLKKIQLDRLLMLAVLCMGCGLLLMAVATVFSVFICGALLYGGGMGFSGVSQNLLIAENAPADKQTRYLSGLHGLYGLSSLAAPFLASRAPVWSREHLGGLTFLGDWRSAYYLTGFLCVLVLLFILTTNAKPAFATHVENENGEDKQNINKKAMVMMAMFFAAYVGAEILVSSRLAQYMRTYFQMNLEESSNYVTYFFIFLLAGRLFYALKNINIPLKTQMTCSLVLSLLTVTLGLLWHPFFLALTGLMMAPFYPMSVSYISEMTGAKKRTYLTAAIAIQSVFVVSMHIGVGYLTDAFGLFYAFGVGLFLLGVSIICLNFHPSVKH